MNKKLMITIAYLFKYLKCLIIMLITAGITIVVLQEVNFKAIIPILFFELFAYSIVAFVIKYLSRKKNPNFIKVWKKHETLLGELKQSNRLDEFKTQNKLMSKANAFKNTYTLYKTTYQGSNILSVDEFKEKFDSGELTRYILDNPSIEFKHKDRILCLYEDRGVDKAGDTIIDEANNGKKSFSQTIMFSFIPYIVVGVISLVGFIITFIFFGQEYLGNIAMISGASFLVIMLVIYFEFKGKFETLLQSIVVMNNMIQYFFDRKKEIPQFSRDTDSLIEFYERNKAE